MEPFEEIKPEHLYIKPLARDIYYTKHPDIPRSESEDENSLSLNGFRLKHDEWKTKICIRRYDAQRRNSYNSRCSVGGTRLTKSNASLNETRRATSLVENKSFHSSDNKVHFKNNDDKVRDFLNRLMESVPPPPKQDLQENCNIPRIAITQPSLEKDFNEIESLNYEEFEKGKLFTTSSRSSLNPTSTLKKSRRSVSFNLTPVDIEHPSWYESIFGISDLITRSKESLQENTHKRDVEVNKSMSGTDSTEYFASWSEIMNECGINNSLVRSKESLQSIEEIVSQSHCANAKIEDISSEDGYAKFAIHKINQTYKSVKGKDSSSLRDLEIDIDDLQNRNNVSNFTDLYSLVPNNVDEIHESVNNVTPECTEL